MGVLFEKIQIFQPYGYLSEAFYITSYLAKICWSSGCSAANIVAPGSMPESGQILFLGCFSKKIGNNRIPTYLLNSVQVGQVVSIIIGGRRNQYNLIQIMIFLIC